MRLGRRTQIRVGEVMVDVMEEEFKEVNEPWSEYRLVDGGTVRLKTTVQRIFRVLDANGKPKVNQDGDPEMMVRHTTQVVATDQ